LWLVKPLSRASQWQLEFELQGWGCLWRKSGRKIDVM
jgi:hypothetical protein